MKSNDNTLNVILAKYFKYLKKRSRLILEKGHRSRRQLVEKQIKRLERKLSRIPNALQKGVIAATLAGATLLSPQIMDAQITFGPIQSNPFSLTHIQGGYYATNFPNSSFADLDNDGDLDMISGSIYFSEFYYFENVGTNTAPDFSAWVSNPFSISTVNGGAFQASFVDLDDDGDYDIMSGRSATWMRDGDFYYFENIGTPSSPDYAAAQINPFSIIAEEGTSSPVFADLDGDGDFDMTTISHDPSKGFEYFENTGSASAPNFALRQHNPFSLTPTTATGNFHGFGDLDNDGDLDLISAENYTSFKYFENIGSSTSPTFGPIQSNPWGPMTSPWRGSATLVDLDNDGDLDLMSGDMSVGFRYFENTSSSSSPCDEVINDGFENGFGSWNDGGNDCARGTQYPNTESYSVRLRDNSGSASSMTSDALDLTAYSELTFEFSFWPNSMENGEDFFLEISTNNGSSYTIYKTWARGTDFNNSTRYDEAVVIDDVTFTNNTKFRLRCDASGNGDQIYIDDVILTGCNTSSNAISKQITNDFESSNIYEFESFDDDIFKNENEEEFTFSPNPASNFIHINGTWADESNEIQLMDIYGQKLLIKTITSGYDEVIKLDIAHLSSGIYIINIIQSKELISSQKIMITNN